MSWLQPRLKNIRKGNVFFLFAGLVLTVLLAAFFVQEASRGTMFSRNASFTEIRPDVARYLPAGVLWDERSVVAVEAFDSEIPSYVVGYADGGQASALLLHWDLRESTFVPAGSFTVEGRTQAFSIPELVAASLGTGHPTAIVLMQEDALLSLQHRIATILLVDGSGLRVGSSIDRDGKVSELKGIFVPVTGDAEAPARFHDVSGDGVHDLLLSVTGGEDADVYEWADGAFRYSERLSWAMVMSRQLFPEPPQAQASEIDAEAVAE